MLHMLVAKNNEVVYSEIIVYITSTQSMFVEEDCLMLKHPSFPYHTDADELILVASTCGGIKSVICEQQIIVTGLNLGH